ncbi:hypothetical protein [Roseibaca calidilacus]|nr:hypothetical protein [Roseibaca calidilacus]CUX80029.1 hypothetical protein Ga0058931_0734 [Roseibaca calidilacus]
MAPWTLETMVNEALVHPPAPSKPSTPSKRLNTKLWQSFTMLFNLINDIEDAESLEDIPEGEILAAMSRIGWRQFGWQVGYKTASRMFRAWWLYNSLEANDHFEAKYGISLERFCFVAFGIAAQLTNFPAVRIDSSMASVGISDAERDAVFNIIAKTSADARREAKNARAGKGQIAYKPSILRRWPLISVQKDESWEAFCPIPTLLYLRMSDGLFYDLVDNDNVRRIIGERFESYAVEITKHYIGTEFQVLSEAEYGAKANPAKTPDVRVVSQQNALRVVIECKARKIPFKVLSSPNPYFENEEIYDELIKGVCQVWRYVSDVRRGVADNNWSISDDVVGLVLMLEPWFQMSSQTVKHITDAAEARCAGTSGILPQDRIAVSFVAMDDWEFSLRKIGAEGMIAALNKHAHPDRFGYMLSTVVEEIAEDFKEPVDAYDYSTGINRVLPWMQDIDEGRVPDAT